MGAVALFFSGRHLHMGFSEIQPGIRVLTLAGDLDLADVQDTLAEFKDLDDVRIAIVDLSAATYMDSSILSLLVNLHRRRRSAGQAVYFVQPNADLSRIFKIVGLDRILTLFGTLDEAVEHARNGP